MRTHDWRTAPGDADTWRCAGCSSAVVSISPPAGDGLGRLQLERGPPCDPARLLSPVPLDCDLAVVKGVMES